MKQLLVIPFILLATLVQGQENATHVTIQLSSSDHLEAKEMIKGFLAVRPHKVYDERLSGHTYFIKFLVNEEVFRAFDTTINRYGVILDRKINIKNISDEIAQEQLRLSFLNDKLTNYEQETDRVREGNKKRHADFWDKTQLIREEIYSTTLRINRLLSVKNDYLIHVTVRNEMTTPTVSGITFVNMPGVEYEQLHIENPGSGVSAKMYEGYGLKYLFTKGKSYINVGAIKSKGAEGEEYDEFFYYGFGQDFYPRHFGRGKRRFLNLYMGYNIGGAFATNDLRGKGLFITKFNLGVELFKSRHVLLDTRVNYWVPFSENRNLRGLGYNVAFNFVF